MKQDTDLIDISIFLEHEIPWLDVDPEFDYFFLFDILEEIEKQAKMQEADARRQGK